MTANSISAAAIQLPVIDISAETSAVGKSMIDAAVKYGFFYIDSKGTPFSEEVVDREFQLVSAIHTHLGDLNS